MGKDLWSEEAVKKGIHKSADDLFPELFGDVWQEAREFFKKSYRSQHLQKVKFLPEAVDLIDFLYNKNILLFVVSNKTGEALRIEASHLKIDNKFFSIVGAGDAAFDKPHKAPVDLVLKGSNIDPQKDLVWFVGDTMTDIWCAINSGCRPILYGERNSIPQEIFESESSKKENSLLNFTSHKVFLKELRKII
ncbi:MAG: phosphoglycolate phosphatase [Rickettsiales bacterium]|jgi:phosphoglycolate phosphatase